MLEAKTDTARVFPDKRGCLGVIEKNALPFKINRVYYLYNVPKGEERGGHAHKKLEQLMFCLHGSVEISLSDGFEDHLYKLNSPEKVLHVVPGMWRGLKFVEQNTVVCVLASHEYDPDDYIHDYDAFLAWKKSIATQSKGGA